jgi:hypothetical protein
MTRWKRSLPVHSRLRRWFTNIQAGFRNWLAHDWNGGRPALSRARRLALEPLEPRWLPSYFTLTPNQQQVLVGGTATLTINAFPTAPDQGVFYYSVEWGDNTYNEVESGDKDGGGPDLPNTYSFSHTYTAPGDYTLSILVVFDEGENPPPYYNGSATIDVTGDPASSPITPTRNCGCINSSGSLDQTNPNATGPTEDESTDDPVRYADGVVTIAETDVRSTGFGFPWGQTRSWTNGAGYAVNSDNGSGWVDTQTPQLLQADGSTNNTLIVINNGTSADYFDLVDGAYQPRFDDPSQLTYNSSTDTYTLLDSEGDQITFTGFSSSRLPAQQGEFASYTDANGETMAVTSYTSDGHIAEMQRSTVSGSDTITESYQYSYLSSSDPNAGLLDNVTLRRQIDGGAWTTVEQAQYTYYDGTQTYGGSLGELMTATTLDGGDNVLSASYYRYYTSADDSTGYNGGLEYVFNGASYARLMGALGTDVSDLTDAQVAPYADNYFQYDSEQRVTEEIVQGAGSSTDSGGLGTYTYNYTASGNAPAVNSWSTKTVVTNPDGSTDTVYTDAYGEVLLDDHYDPSSGVHNDTFYQYNAAGQLTLMASPSAVSGYDDSNADLLDNEGGSYLYLNYNSGLLSPARGKSS